MAWDTASTPISDSRLGHLRQRLLWSYLAVIAVILGAFSLAVYGLVARDRHQQLNLHVRQVATASASTLEIIQHEYNELIGMDEEDGEGGENGESEESGDGEAEESGDDEDDHEGANEGEYAADELADAAADRTLPLTLQQLMAEERTANTAAIVTNPFTPVDQGVEWFDRDRRVLVREGQLFPKTPLPTDLDRDGEWETEGTIRSFILPVYAGVTPDQLTLVGYVRASESTTHLEAELQRLLGGLALGVIIVSGLVTWGGVWLTRESLQPVLASLTQLKQFTADASHELRNPLTAIRASIAVMQSHPERIHPADVDKLQAIASAAVQMSQLVDDLLLLARLDRQSPDRQTWQAIALDELLEDLVNLYHDRAQQQQLDLAFKLTTDADITGDAAQLQRLFTNLITNGIQYTPPGGTVTVGLGRQGTQAIVTVQDTGIGIAPDQLPHLFDRFWRADQARSQHHHGAGLGLAIAQAVVEQHGGTITAHSQLNQGSTFTVQLLIASK